MPQPGSVEYRDFISAFYSGVAAMEVGEDLRAAAKLEYVTELAPLEPAGWANRALMSMRRGEMETAKAHLAEALAVDPEGTYVPYLSGLMALREGRTEEGQQYLRDAVAADSTNLRASYALWESLGEDDVESAALLAAMRRSAPDNLVLLLADVRQGVAKGERGSAQSLMNRLSAETAQMLGDALQSSSEGDVQSATMQLSFLRNVLLQDPVFRQDLLSVRAPVEVIAYPMVEFRRIEAPAPTPAAKDDSLRFETFPLMQEAISEQLVVAPVALGNGMLPAVFFTDGDSLLTVRGEAWPFPGVPSRHAILGVDYNFDFRTDLGLVGSEGLRILAQDSTEAFADVTSTLGLDTRVLENAYTGIWAADLDLEGDMDLILAAERVRLLRNNGDGTFIEVDYFGDRPAPVNFLWADIDSDGDSDAVWPDEEGDLHIMFNERQARFAESDTPDEIGRVVDLVATDSNSDGVIDLLLLTDGGEVRRLQYQLGWSLEGLGNAPEGADRILAGDLDNNGGVDIIFSGSGGSTVWLQDEDYSFHIHDQTTEVEAQAVVALWRAGTLDLAGLDESGQPVRAEVISPQDYHWKEIRPRAAAAVGDQRINAFGIGGEVEIRAGALYQKQPITQPIIHFGLGNDLLADVVRITWPNGTVQAEFDVQSGSVISAQQRLSGSCPWLFAYDGTEMQFVTDFIWRSPLGLAINAQETAGVMTTEDWVKIRGDQLQPKNGNYDVRITGELWESHFFDHIYLMVVDHPVDTEIFLDERFAFPPPEFSVQVTQPLQSLVSVITDTGEDASERVSEMDAQYLDFFGRGNYQGITRDHYIELDFGPDLPESSWLVANGWLRPTDSSINVAISHGTQPPPSPLRIDVLRENGNWETVYPNLGFPSGKTKTILIDLEGIFASNDPRRIRLHTNLEIFWDALHWAAKASSEEAQITPVAPGSAHLRYRGFSRAEEADRSSPELPEYGVLEGTAPIWRDLIGYYTRFGDVGELLSQVDDRYVIMNAGDELVLLFPEAGPVKEGWTRDYVLVGDGWVKDGNLNTTAGKYLRPLPSHDEPNYWHIPGELRNDPVYQRHFEDWVNYHTRYVAPDRFGQVARLR